MRLLTVAAALLLLLSATSGAQQQQGAPANASASPTRTDRKCNAGYIERQASCVSVIDATDNEIKGYLVAQSVASYSGNCPCPYNFDRAGRSCGRRSAYSRPGGKSPLCYERDVSDAEVQGARASARKKP